MNQIIDMRKTIPFIALLLLFSMSSIAQIDRTKAPKAGPAPKVDLKKAETFKLENGLTVIVVENHKLPKVDIQMKFDIPLVHQGENAGYIDMLGQLLASGTRRHTKQDIDEMVDGAGAKLYTSKDGIYISTLKKSFPKMMDLVYAITVSSSFPPEEFVKEKKRFESSITQRQDDPDEISATVAKALTYRKGHPYGEVVTEESLAKVQRKHVESYYKRYFTPENGYLVFVGDISKKEAKETAEKYFLQWKGSGTARVFDQDGNEIVDGIGVVRAVTKHAQPLKERRVAFVDKPGSTQSIIKVVYPVDLKPNDDRLLAAQVMNTILGGGVFNARLMQNLREDKAYTYGAYSSLKSDRYVGGFTASTSVRNEVTRQAIGQTLFEMQRMREDEVTKEELDLAKSYLAGQFGRSLEDPKTIARFALNTALYGLPEDHYKTYLERLDKITTADVLKAAQDFILDKRAYVTVVGDKEQVANTLTAFSERQSVVYYDANGDIYREKTERPPSDLTAQQVMDKYYAAIGGKSRLDAVNDLQVIMSTVYDEKDVLSVTMKSKPNNYRYEMTIGNNIVTKIVYDGTKAMLLDEYGYTTEMDLDVYEVKTDAQVFPELTYFDGRFRVMLSGSVEIEGEKAWKLTIQTENGNVFFEYYSADSGLKLKRSERKYTDNGTVEFNTSYKDYRSVDGIMFPHLVKESSSLNLTFVVDKIELNKGIGPALFQMEE